MSSARKKLKWQENVTPSPSKKLKFFTPERCLSPAADRNHQGKLVDRLREPILQCKLMDLTTVQGMEIFLVTKLGLEKTMLLFQSLGHVPEGFPLRMSYVSNILVSAGLENEFEDLQYTLQHIDKLVCQDSTCLNGPISRDHLWKTSEMFKTTHMGFVMTKAECCLEEGCCGKLYGSQKDTIQVTVFTMNGPIPYLKATLKCRSCGSRYNIDKYHSVEGISKFYPNALRPDYIAASSRVLFTRDTFEMMCEAGIGDIKQNCWTMKYRSQSQLPQPMPMAVQGTFIDEEINLRKEQAPQTRKRRCKDQFMVGQKVQAKWGRNEKTYPAKIVAVTEKSKRLEGIWHTGIVAYGQEFYFGGTGGIECCPPCGTILGQPDVKHTVGHTEIPYEIFIDYLMDLSKTTYRPVDYHLLDHNCNTFSSEVARFLTGNDIPSYVTGLPAEVMSTPFGQMIRPFIDSMSVQPTGGHSLFPGASSNPGAPPGTSQTQQSSSQPAKTTGKATAEKQIPYTFKQSVASEAMWMDEGSELSTIDKALMKEIYEYLSERDPAWSLGRNHLNFLFKLVLENDHLGVDALFILQKLVLVEDVIGIIQNDPNSLLKDILGKFDDTLETKRAEVTKMLCNCSSHTSGQKLILQENREPYYGKLTCSICVACVLSDIEKLRVPGAALCYNLSLNKLSEDVQLELGSALLNCLNQDMNEETAFHSLTALVKFIEGNPEVKGLAEVLDIDLQPLRCHSDRVTALCDKIQGKLH